MTTLSPRRIALVAKILRSGTKSRYTDLAVLRRVSLALVMPLAASAAAGVSASSQRAEEVALYACAANTSAEVKIAGVILCDAQPTDALTERAARDHLQIRDGTLVVQVDEDGPSDLAGLQAGDVIYRVGGVDVTNAEAAAKNLASVRSTADTVVNFLRGGRPYRVKLRRD